LTLYIRSFIRPLHTEGEVVIHIIQWGAYGLHYDPLRMECLNYAVHLNAFY